MFALVQSEKLCWCSQRPVKKAYSSLDSDSAKIGSWESGAFTTAVAAPASLLQDVHLLVLSSQSLSYLIARAKWGRFTVTFCYDGVDMIYI